MSSLLADFPALSACADPAPGAGRSRWAFWRSPYGQPPWARPVLLGLAALAALLYTWNITSAGLAEYSSVAVKSMSESWKAFFYGAFDPAATITIDKLAGSFLPQALSARIFGYHAWSLALPQVIEGVISVLVMYRVVRRWAGVLPGLLAAGIFALTPVAASMFGHSMEDGALTMCLVLAADAWQRAVMTARLRALVWAGVWVGLGFQAKMMQAWMVLPALAIGYLLAAPAGLGRRFWHLGVAGTVMLAVSLSWIALYTFTPASDRPYVDGSTNNSAVAMAFGYNGLARFGITVSGAAEYGIPSGSSGSASTAGPGPSTGTAAAGGNPAQTANGNGNGNAVGSPSGQGGWTKLAGSRFGPQIGWLYPLALLALIAVLAWRGRASRTDQLRGGLVMWGIWLLTFGAIFSDVQNIPHVAYVASLAPPIAALCGAGIVLFWRWYRSGDSRWWLVPLAVAAELCWAAYLWRTFPGFLPWARWTATVVGIAALIALLLARVSGRARARIAVASLTAGVAAVLAMPATWAASVLDVQYAGNASEASAGPGGFGGPATTLDASGYAVYTYLTAHRDGASYLLAIENWPLAGALILATGQEVLPIGGFTGSVPGPTLVRVKQLVSTGQLKFFYLKGRDDTGAGQGTGGGSGEPQKIASWVRATCTNVTAEVVAAIAGTTGVGVSNGGSPNGSAMYECAGHA